MATEGNEPAYPINLNGEKYSGHAAFDGMTKREAFVMAAMQSIAGAWVKGGGGNSHAEMIARQSIEIADACIEALNKPQD